MKATKWRSVLGLLLVYIAVFLNWQWLWGVLFLFWIIPDFFTGETSFIEPIERQENPILYWTILLTWLVLSLYLLATLFFDEGVLL
jgi:hypothetical protein